MFRHFYIIPSLVEEFGSCIYSLGEKQIECSFFEVTNTSIPSHTDGYIATTWINVPLKLIRLNKKPKRITSKRIPWYEKTI